MAENAGTVYAEIRVALDKLHGDIDKATQSFTKIGTAVTNTSNQTTNQFSVMGKDIGKGLDNLSNTAIGQFAKMAKGMQAAFMAVPLIGLITMVVGAVKKLFSGIAAWLKETSEAYRKHQSELAKMSAILQSTGAIAWTTTQQLAGMADQLSRNSMFAQDDIMKMQTVLLGFRSITGEVFTKTTQAIVDMVSVMGGDLASTANIVGKAIDTPVKGMTALSRQGFIFTEQEKAMVAELENAGKHLEAQNVIVEALTTTFGGAAEAISNVNASQAALAKEQERLNIALGEATSGWTKFWTDRKTERVRDRADWVIWQQSVSKALNFDYAKEMEVLERQAKRHTPEIHFKMIADLNVEDATNKLVLAQDEFNRIQQALRDERYSEADAEAVLKPLRETLTLAKLELNERQKIRAEVQATATKEQERLNLENAELNLLNDQKATAESLDSTLKTNLKNIRAEVGAGILGAAEGQQKMAEAYKNYAQSLIGVKTAIEGITTTQEVSQQLQNQLLAGQTEEIRKAVEQYQLLNIEKAGGPKITTGKELTDFRLEQEKILADAIFMAKEQADARYITEEQANKNILAARKRFAEALQSFLVEREIPEAGNEVSYATMRKGLADVVAEQDRLQKSQQSMAEANWTQNQLDQLTKLKGSTKEIKELEHRRYMDAIKDSATYKNASEATQKSMIAMGEKVYNALTSKNPWEKMLDYVKQYGQQTAAIINQLVAIWVDSVKRENDEHLRLLEERYENDQEEADKRYEYLQTDLDRRLQAELYAAGLIEAYDSESAEQTLERARQSLNEREILTATNNLKRKQIEEKYAKEQKANDEQQKAEQKQRDEEAAKAKAELEYKSAVATWQQQLIQAVLNAAMAVSSAAVNMWPIPAIPMMALAGGLGAAQVAAVSANKPKLQSFANGGIIAGNSFSGDNVLGRFNSGERIVTQKQQERMTDILDGDSTGNGQVIVIHNHLELDGLPVAEIVAKYMNDGLVQLRGDRVLI
jgi:hypothetical protein